jgi:hypothetical protein
MPIVGTLCNFYAFSIVFGAGIYTRKSGLTRNPPFGNCIISVPDYISIF